MADPDYFTLAELRALPQMSDATKYPEARVLAAAAYITSIIEREVGTSFVPRAVTETLDGTGGPSLSLGSPYVQSLSSVTAGGTVLNLATVRATRGFGLLEFVSGGSVWPTGRDSVTVAYLSGYSTTPPADIKEAALTATRWRLLATNSNAELDARRTSLTNDMGGTTSYAIAGPDRPTGYPEVDAVIMGWKHKLDVHGFA